MSESNASSSLTSAEDIDAETSVPNSDDSVSQSVYVVPKKPIVPVQVSILIESLVEHLAITHETNKQKAAIIYKTICDALYKMGLIGESYEMPELEGIRSQYRWGFLHLLKSAKAGDGTLPLQAIWPSLDINSHYAREFDEEEYIAKGGFGQVYKVKHKLDGTEYAVKKIPIDSEGIDSVKSYLSEVKTFASMNHPNVVQYKAAWLEIGPPSTNKAITGPEMESFESTRSIKTNHITTYVYHQDATDSLPDKNRKDDSSDFVIDFEHSASGIVNRPKKQSRKMQKRHSISEGGESISKIDLREIKKVEKIMDQGKRKIKWATLYIQMSLCQCTLKQWLEERNSVLAPDKAVVLCNDQTIRLNTIKQILMQILKGLDYIHSKGIVHHDIKPSNIFIETDNGSMLVQLGDFGLACPLQSVRHCLAFGTKMYAAPEQLAGKCDPKSDMYSVGIVLYELVESFKTDMERVQYITELRKGHVPSDLSSRQPEMAQYITRLIKKSPRDRPDTTELLHLVRSSESEQIEQLKLQLAEKDEEISHLKELLKVHGIKSV